MNLLNSIISHILQTLLLLGCAITAIILILIYYCIYDLPDYKQLINYQLPTVSKAYSHDNLIISEYFHEYRIFAPISTIPKRLINSFIAVEDKSFYHNPGIDFIGIVRSTIHNIANIKSSNRNLVGGSTITQQVVKNFLLSNEKSLKRKIREAVLAFKISRVLSKDHIMELYLNKIYFGHGTYGIVAAALKYFNKSIHELTLEECALLAALPQAPSRLDPFKNKDLVKDRRNWVLYRMEEEKFISHEERKNAQLMPVKLDNSYTEQNKFKADFFADEVKRGLIKLVGEKTVFEGGLFIKTTLVPEYQTIAENAVVNGLRNYDQRYTGWKGAIGHIEDITNKKDEEWINELNNFQSPQGMKEWNIAVILSIDKKGANIGLTSGEKSQIPNSQLSWIYKNLDNLNSEEFKDISAGDIVIVNKIKKQNHYELKQIPEVNGALVMMDANTGKVLAMVGGYDYNRSQFNVATQAKRQPGSIFKPFVYIAGLENKFTLATIINDEEIEIDQGPLLPAWKPKNYNDKFYGLVTLRRGLELSQNTVTVQIARLIGVDKVANVAKRFNIYKNHKANYAMSLGSNEVDLLNITTAYAMLANGGFYIEPQLIEFVSNSKGKVIFRRNKECSNCTLTKYFDDFTIIMPPNIKVLEKRIIDSNTVSQTISLLQGSVQKGTSMGAKSIGKNIAAKTGTSNNGIDNWFIGFWQNIVVGVYVGFDTPQTLGKDATGARVALPIFRSFMKDVLKNKKDMPFKLSKELELVRIVRKTGLIPTEDTPISDTTLELFQKNTRQLHSNFIFDDIIRYIEETENDYNIIH